MSGLEQTWSAVPSPQTLHWSTVEQFGHLLLWVVSSSSTLMVQSSAYITTWPSVCLATARMSCRERLANMTSWTRLSGSSEVCANPHFCHFCFFINRVSLSWCLVSIDGCQTQMERPVHSLILKWRLVKIQRHPKYWENLVRICISLRCVQDVTGSRLTRCGYLWTVVSEIRNLYRNTDSHSQMCNVIFHAWHFFSSHLHHITVRHN